MLQLGKLRLAACSGRPGNRKGGAGARAGPDPPPLLLPRVLPAVRATVLGEGGGGTVQAGPKACPPSWVRVRRLRGNGPAPGPGRTASSLPPSQPHAAVRGGPPPRHLQVHSLSLCCPSGLRSWSQPSPQLSCLHTLAQTAAHLGCWCTLTLSHHSQSRFCPSSRPS